MAAKEITQEELKMTEIAPPPVYFEDGGEGITRGMREDLSGINNVVVGIHSPAEGGILNYRKGDKFPSWGWQFKEGIVGADISKRAAASAIRFALSKPVRYFLPLIMLVPGSIRNLIVKRALESYVDLTHVMFTRLGAYPKEQYFSPAPREVLRAAMKVANGDYLGERIAKTLAMVLEFDDAYRYRLQDVIGEADREILRSNPSKEIARLFRLMASRDSDNQARANGVAKILPWVMRIGIIRETVCAFFNEVNFNKLEMDDYDRYKCMIWPGYQFGGIPIETRLAMRSMIDSEWMQQGAVPVKHKT